jgi:hypothetical protein
MANIRISQLPSPQTSLTGTELVPIVQNGQTVQTTLTNVATLLGVSSINFGSTGLTPATATSGAVTVAGTLAVANGGTGQTSYTNGQLLIGNTTGNTLTKATLTAGSGVSITNGAGSITIAISGTGAVTSFQTSLSGLTPSTATGGAITLAGTLGVASGGTGLTTLTAANNALYSTSSSVLTAGTLPVLAGGTGVTASSGANSVVLRDASSNITANALDDAYTNTAASGTLITLTVASPRRHTITGSGGQTIKLPDATTLANGTIFQFDNNQSSGAITVNNNSNSLIVSVPSGGFVLVNLLSNTIAAGSWDRHDQAPSNVSWSTNTFDYAGSITSATWNGTTVAYNRGGTGQSSAFVAGGIVYGSTTSALAVTSVGTAGQVLLSNGASAPIWSSVNGGTF